MPIPDPLMGAAWLVPQSIVKNWFRAFEPLLTTVMPPPGQELERIGSIGSMVRVRPELAAVTLMTVPQLTVNGVVPRSPARAGALPRDRVATTNTPVTHLFMAYPPVRVIGRFT